LLVVLTAEDTDGKEDGEVADGDEDAVDVADDGVALDGKVDVGCLKVKDEGGE
jgi:hypothetical protein